MQLKNATNLELRLMECVHRCETELPASELETRVVSCMCDAANELQRLRGIITLINSESTRGTESFPRPISIAPWASHLYIGQKSHDQIWVRWCGSDYIYRWLHPVKNQWVEEPEQINMPTFSNYASAYLAANQSPEPPTWQEFVAKKKDSRTL